MRYVYSPIIPRFKRISMANATLVSRMAQLGHRGPWNLIQDLCKRFPSTIYLCLLWMGLCEFHPKELPRNLFVAVRSISGEFLPSVKMLLPYHKRYTSANSIGSLCIWKWSNTYSAYVVRGFSRPRIKRPDHQKSKSRNVIRTRYVSFLTAYWICKRTQIPANRVSLVNRRRPLLMY